MARKVKKKYIIFIILIAVAAFLAVSYFTESAGIIPEAESEIEGNTDVFPVLYFEKRSGTWKFGAYTFLLDGSTVTELEPHSRTFSRTYPLSAYERLKYKYSSVADYGQLMVYYNSPDGEISVFEHYKTNDFTIIKNGIKATVPRNHYETYHEFLCFGENYYLFTFPDFDVDILRVYKLSENLETEKTFDIDYGKLNIKTTAFIDNSLIVVGNNLFSNVGNKILKYNIETGETELLSPGYGLFGMAADGNRFHTIGHKNGKYIFETFDSEGNTIGKPETSLPFGVDYSPYTFSSDGTFYMYGTEIYLNLSYEENCYILSFDIESGEWKNQWVVTKKDSPYFPQNIKFTVRSENGYYDLFPFRNSIK